MEDYPRTLLELERRFSTDDACREYLESLRWPDGFVCPECGTEEAWAMTNGLWLCRGCRRQVSVTAGTIFHRTRLPLTLWFRAIWHVTSQKNGTSAMSVQRILGLGSYRTAWTWLHKLRRAMVRPDRDRLGGCVEVDESFVGGDEPGCEGRGAVSKTLVAIAAEERGRGTGRIRMACIPDASKRSLHGVVQQTVEPGSLIHTDGWAGYDGLEAHGYRHRVTALKGQPKDAAVVEMPRVHRVASLLKRWLLGTHQGAVSSKHLEYYLDEFTFRFNRRTSRSRGKLFYRLLQQAVQISPTPYSRIITPQDLGGG
jgi:transposase-like protein